MILPKGLIEGHHDRLPGSHTTGLENVRGSYPAAMVILTS